jgi:hypothetical protein
MCFTDELIRNCLKETGYIENNGKRIYLQGFAKLLDGKMEGNSVVQSSDVEELLPKSLYHLEDRVTSYEKRATEVDVDVEIDTVEVDNALNDAIPDILHMLGVSDASAINKETLMKRKPQVFVLFLPLLSIDDNDIESYALYPVSRGLSSSSSWLVKTSCKINIDPGRETEIERTNPRMLRLKDILDRALRALCIDLGNFTSFVDLFDIGYLTEEMLRVQDLYFVITNKEHILHKDDMNFTKGMYYTFTTINIKYSLTSLN